MRLGMPIWPGNGDILNNLERASMLGFDYVELAFDYPWPEELSGDDISRISDRLELLGLDCAIHGPWRSQSISHPIDEMADAAVRVIERQLGIADELRARYFNIHLNTSAYNFSDVPSAQPHIVHNAVSSMSRLSKSGKERGIMLTVENLMQLFGIPSTFQKVFSKVDGWQFCLDVGHAVLSWVEITNERMIELEEPMQISDWTRKLGDFLKVSHIHNIGVHEGVMRDHVLINNGILDMGKIIELVKKTNCEYILLEQFYENASKKRVNDQDLKMTLDEVRRYF